VIGQTAGPAIAPNQAGLAGDIETPYLPLVIAVTGHRDLVPAEEPAIRERVVALFDSLANEYPDLRLTLMSPLAAGADLLAAEVAVEMSIRLVVPLPMSKNDYLRDFEGDRDHARFARLCAKAEDVFELPVLAAGSEEEQRDTVLDRDRQYAQLGVFLSAHCHILLALWDGKPAEHLGGTAQVVEFHHSDLMPGYTPTYAAPQQILIDDESDLVYHIVCSRARDDGHPADPFQALDCSWFTNSAIKPRSAEMPNHHRTIFERASEFSRLAVQHNKAIDNERNSLLGDGPFSQLPAGLVSVDRMFGIADWLALHYQKKTVGVLRLTHILAVLMGLMFVLYSDFATIQFFLQAFFVFFVVAVAFQSVAQRRAWHRKYLDYRALAEGLRVQFYWAAAGVTNSNISKFSHDIYLQTKDPEMGWIRNVMRVAGTRCDASPTRSTEGLAFALREWVGNDNHGQLGFYQRKSAERSRRHRITELLGQASLLVSVLVVVTFLVGGVDISPDTARILTTVMGSTLVLFAVRHGYAYATAEKELIRQYNFMLRIFRNARRRIAGAATDEERRQVLSGLGGYALDEHAEWILMHRERAIDQGEIWRLGSGS
jgi:uncharacterized membrane protein